MYAPLGTRMALGDYVRVVRAFVEAFKWAADEGKGEAGEGGAVTSGEEEKEWESGDEQREEVKRRKARVYALQNDLKVRYSPPT